MTGCLRLGLAGALLALLGACSFDTFTYTTSRYGMTGAVRVTLRCRDTYEVYDRSVASAMLIVTNPANEALAGCWDNGPDLSTRMREVARIFFEEKTNRPLCRITREQELTIVHRELEYRCPADPAAAKPKPEPRRT